MKWSTVLLSTLLVSTSVCPVAMAQNSPTTAFPAIDLQLLGVAQNNPGMPRVVSKQSVRALKVTSTSRSRGSLTLSQLQQAAISASRQSKVSTNVGAPLISRKQQRGLENLATQSRSSSAARVYFDSRFGTPTLIKIDGKPPSIAARSNPDDAARESAGIFLNTNKDLLKLENPGTDLQLARMQRDVLGNRHLKYRQVVAGIPVWGSDLKLHLRPDNSVYLLSGRYQPSITSLNTTASITAAVAEANVMQELNLSWVSDISSELLIYNATSGQATLSYKVEVRPDMGQRWIYFIDAHSGKVVHKIQNIQETVVPGQGLDTDGVLRSFNAWSENSSFYLIDPTTPLDDPAHDPLNENKPKGDTYIYDVRNGDGSSLFYSTSNNSNSGWDPDGVSAIANTRTVYDYFLNTHGRQSIDDDNKNLLVAIHFDTNLNNAFWNGTFMVYGDGDNVTFSSLAGCLDVAAHEMTHGVIETSANLRYENQSGALNESFADIFGAMVDRDDWLLGEDCVITGPGYLRNMENPAQGLSAQPSKMSEYQNLPNTPAGDNGGVHINSGIPNRAAYLLAEGLSVESLGTSIGKDKMEQIFYRALTIYLTSSSQFIDARRATIQSAEDLYGVASPEALAVATAWDTVEVIEGNQTTPDNPDPTSTDPIAGADLMVYLYPTDGTRDYNASDFYAVYLQEVNDSLVYDPNLDVDLLNTVSALDFTRPAIFSDNLGSWVYYVGVDNNIHEISVQTGFVTQLTTTADIWSIAISGDGRYVSYTTTDNNDNNIYVIDVVNASETSFPVLPPDYSQGGSQAFNTALYADSMSFDYTGRFIVFDYYNCLTTELSACSTGGGYNYWSVGVMDAETGDMFFPFANQDPTTDLGFPQFAQNNNYIISLDIHDYSVPGSISSRVVTLDFNLQQVETVRDFGTGVTPVFGTPSFWGADNYVTIQAPAGGPAGTIARRVSLGTNGDGPWEGDNGAVGTINSFAVAMPLMHRAGQRALTGTIEADTNNLDFGDVLLNTQQQRTITLTNNGNSDVSITDINLTGSNFSHNGTNTLVPRQSSVSLQVEFDASATEGTRTGIISFSTDNNGPVLSISLVGNSVSNLNAGSSGVSSGGSGGSSISYQLFWLLLGVALIKWNKTRLTL